MNIIERVADLDGIQAAERLKINFFTGEEKAHKFVLTPPEGTVALTGSVSATFLRADRTTWDLLGTLVDGNAEVILTSECYQCAGTFTFSIYLTEGESRVCVYVANGNVISTQTDQHYDGGMVTDLTQLLGEAGELQEDLAALSGTVGNHANRIATINTTLNTLDSTAVKTSSQTFTLPGKMRARANIEAARQMDHITVPNPPENESMVGQASTVVVTGNNAAANWRYISSFASQSRYIWYCVTKTGSLYTAGTYAPNYAEQALKNLFDGYDTTGGMRFDHAPLDIKTRYALELIYDATAVQSGQHYGVYLGTYGNGAATYMTILEDVYQAIGRKSVRLTDELVSAINTNKNLALFIKTPNGLRAAGDVQRLSIDWTLTALPNTDYDGSLTLGKGTTNEVTVTAAQLKQLLALLS